MKMKKYIKPSLKNEYLNTYDIITASSQGSGSGGGGTSSNSSTTSSSPIDQFNPDNPFNFGDL